MASLIHTFSGGVFVAIGLAHIYPEVGAAFTQSMIEFHEMEDPINFPLPQAMFILGFGLILYLSKVLCAHSHSH